MPHFTTLTEVLAGAPVPAAEAGIAAAAFVTGKVTDDAVPIA
jgi:hypothetical protein